MSLEKFAKVLCLLLHQAACLSTEGIVKSSEIESRQGPQSTPRINIKYVYDQSVQNISGPGYSAKVDAWSFRLDDETQKKLRNHFDLPNLHLNWGGDFYDLLPQLEEKLLEARSRHRWDADKAIQILKEERGSSKDADIYCLLTVIPIDKSDEVASGVSHAIGYANQQILCNGTVFVLLRYYPENVEDASTMLAYLIINSTNRDKIPYPQSKETLTRQKVQDYLSTCGGGWMSRKTMQLQISLEDPRRVPEQPAQQEGPTGEIAARFDIPLKEDTGRRERASRTPT